MGAIIFFGVAVFALINLVYILNATADNKFKSYVPLNSIWDYYDCMLEGEKMNLFGKIVCSIVVCLFCFPSILILSLIRFIIWSFYYKK